MKVEKDQKYGLQALATDTWALLISKDRRHLFVTPFLQIFATDNEGGGAGGEPAGRLRHVNRGRHDRPRHRRLRRQVNKGTISSEF